jgi:type II secretory pathway component PulJ
VRKNERGTTLIELLVALSIWGLVGVAVSGGIYQLFKNTELNGNHMSAVLQVERADQRISRDASKAQIIDTVNLTSPEFMAMTWIDGDNGDEYQVTYTLEDMADSETLKQLVRYQSVNDSENTAVLIASYIDPSLTSANFSGDILTMTFTARVGSANAEGRETRVNRVITMPE